MEVEEARRQQEVARTALLQATTTPNHHHVKDHDEDDNDDEGLSNGDVSRELCTGDEPIIDPVGERQTHAEKNERLQNQLKVSSFKLSGNLNMYGCY